MAIANNPQDYVEKQFVTLLWQKLVFSRETSDAYPVPFLLSSRETRGSGGGIKSVLI